MYTLPAPPYLLMVAGLLACLTSGKAFEVTLKQSVQEWSKTRSSEALGNLRSTELFVPFLGIATGSWVFLGSGLMIFGFAAVPCYLLSLILTIVISVLVWFQLGKLLLMLEQGGSQALDLDSW